MRLLGVLALVTPVLVGILFLSDPELTASWVEAGYRPIVAAVTAVSIGVAFTSLICWTIVRIRYGRLTKAAERIAAGDYGVAVSERGGGLEARLARAINGVAASLADTHDRATIDRLTGVANRQALLAALFAEVERASRYERPLCVAFVDIDHFKAVNDSYGHAAGDIVLRGVAQTIAENLRASDLIGRYGGEEFMLILTETTVDEGAALSEKLRKLVERSRHAVEANPELSVTISIGIVGGIGQHLRMEQLVRDADAAMYSAKSLGRNQTYIFEEPDEESRVPRAPISDAGRARAIEIGREAAPGRDGHPDLAYRAPPPLPRSAIGADRGDRGRTWRAGSSCPRERSTGSAWPRCSTTWARSRCRNRSSTSRQR
jgi:diguanylate cyclase (GGDEF)-like protein